MSSVNSQEIGTKIEDLVEELQKTVQLVAVFVVLYDRRNAAGCQGLLTQVAPAVNIHGG